SAEASPGKAVKSSGVGPAPWKESTIEVEVGLHQASPPPSYWGNSPVCVSCESVGTGRSTAAPSKRLGIAKLNAAEVIAATMRTVGVIASPALRYSVTTSR